MTNPKEIKMEHNTQKSAKQEDIILDSGSFEKPKPQLSSEEKATASGDTKHKGKTIDSNSSGHATRHNHDNHNSSVLTEGLANAESTGLRTENEGSGSEDDVLTGSYGEISLDQDLINYDKNSDSNSSKEDEPCFFDEYRKDVDCIKGKKRPDSLVWTQDIRAGSSGDHDTGYHIHQGQQTSERQLDSREVSPSLSSEEYAFHSSGHVRTGSDTSGLSELQGTLTVDGDLVTFVAEDLQEKIKMSSPVSRWADSSLPGSRSSTPSLYKQTLQSSHQIIDPNILVDLESHTKKVATCVDTMLENLSGTLQSISSLTVDCMETYESSVCKTCDAVDANIKSVYQLMAKSEELNNSIAPLYKLSSDVKHIKKILEQLEHAVEHKS